MHYIASTTFTLPSKYSDLKAIGKGSYGVVVSAEDSSTSKRVAIKKITPVAKHTIDAKHILREIRIMRYMGAHENIISLEDLVIRESSDELYIVMELLESDLHRVLQSKQPLSENHFRHFTFQLLCGLKHLHRHRIIHRDLKPGNLLVTRDCKLRITDFGLARERPIGKGADPEHQIDEPMTEHVVTRWYRPPELMLCPDGLYTYAVDLWSVGCIFAEMLGRKPLFPGKNFVHQLSLIFDVIGSPTPNKVIHVRNAQARKFIESQQNKTAKPFSFIFPGASQDALELLAQLLVFSPDERVNVDEALRGNFLAEVGTGSPSLLFPDVTSACDFEFEHNNASKFQLKALIQLEVAAYHVKSNALDAPLSHNKAQGTTDPIVPITSFSSAITTSANANDEVNSAQLHQQRRPCKAPNKTLNRPSSTGAVENYKSASIRSIIITSRKSSSTRPIASAPPVRLGGSASKSAIPSQRKPVPMSAIEDISGLVLEPAIIAAAARRYDSLVSNSTDNEQTRYTLKAESDEPLELATVGLRPVSPSYTQQRALSAKVTRAPQASSAKSRSTSAPTYLKTKRHQGIRHEVDGVRAVRTLESNIDASSRALINLRHSPTRAIMQQRQLAARTARKEVVDTRTIRAESTRMRMI